MPSSRRDYCRRAAGLLALAAGCSGRSGDERSSPTETGTSVETDDPSATQRTTASPTGTQTDSSPGPTLVLQPVDRADLPPRARVGVVAPEVWTWLTTAIETGAVDVGTDDEWTPTFPDADPTPTPQSTHTGAPNVDLALATADVVVVDGEPYAVRTTYAASEASYGLKVQSVETVPTPDDAEGTGETDETRVVAVADLPTEQRRIALAAVEADGYYVGFHEERSEAFEAVVEYDYLRHEGQTYETFVVHGDKFVTHTTLWATPIDAPDDGDDVVFEVEPVTLSERGREVVAAAIEDGTETVESVPQTLSDAVEAYDLLATTTALYRVRLDR